MESQILNALLNVISQSPTIAVLVAVVYWMSKNHQASIQYYRAREAQHEAFMYQLVAKSYKIAPPIVDTSEQTKDESQVGATVI